ncbi:MAG: 16S rRNA processing protein RimM [Chloroflexi bacterium]|nr:16S rRNA processing protein RimM [Chloroflexota bacterium]
MTKQNHFSTHKNDQRGSVDDSAEPHFLVIGKILKPHGVRGEMRVLPYTDLPERFTWLKSVYMGQRKPKLIEVESVRFHKNLILLKLVGYDSRESIDSLRNQWLQVPESEAIPLKEDEYFLYQLEGLTVKTDEGELLGTIKQVIETGANNVFVIKGSRGELLIPDTKEVILDIDFDADLMLVHIIDGLF